MCGIAGLATAGGLRHADGELVDRMLRSLAHRGPDDQHTLGDSRALIGARRLSIIDLEGGRQPLTDESGLVLASQNGEIYNYVELRDDLERKGHTLTTHGDTETIVHLYEEYGPDFAKHLRGMFAIAIWDGRAKRLVLARDRLGKKPLYWRLANGRLSYGSELKAILADESVGRTVDREALALYLQYQYVPAPRTILTGVSKLPPASVLVWDGDGPRIERYWDPTYEPKASPDPREDLERAMALLRESVRLRLRSDVPVGVFLSGGMDSSVVTALMAEATEGQVRTFSIGFENAGFDELPYARRVAQLFDTDHTEDIVRLDAISLLPELADHYDEPFGDSSAVPTFRVSQLAAARLKVVLTGDGGDESFGGYTRYRAQRVLGKMDIVPSSLMRVGLRSGRAALTPLGSQSQVRRRLGRLEALVGMDPDQRYVALMTIIGDSYRARLLPDQRPQDGDQYLLEVLRAGPQGGVDRMLHADLLTYLPEDLLVKMDRATMANSLEARAPLLDHKLVEFAAALPADRKMKGDTTKVILREIAKTLMPADVIDRPKMGFGVPVGDWFRTDLGERFRELVLGADAMSRDHLDVTVAAELLAEHQAGTAHHDARLWSLLMFELWARRWLRPNRDTASGNPLATPARPPAAVASSVS